MELECFIVVFLLAQRESWIGVMFIGSRSSTDSTVDRASCPRNVAELARVLR
jgi:hypothetical protein